MTPVTARRCVVASEAPALKGLGYIRKAATPLQQKPSLCPRTWSGDPPAWSPMPTKMWVRTRRERGGFPQCGPHVTCTWGGDKGENIGPAMSISEMHPLVLMIPQIPSMFFQSWFPLQVCNACIACAYECDTSSIPLGRPTPYSHASVLTTYWHVVRPLAASLFAARFSRLTGVPHASRSSFQRVSRAAFWCPAREGNSRIPVDNRVRGGTTSVKGLAHRGQRKSGNAKRFYHDARGAVVMRGSSSMSRRLGCVGRSSSGHL